MMPAHVDGAAQWPLSPGQLVAYLERIGLKAVPSADADGLAQLQRAHRLAIPFENLDILLGRGISLDPGAVFEKLVGQRRGGYCFEHNALFGSALAALGYEARPLLARVWLFADAVPPRTHTLSPVTIDGREWIADPGFGGAYTPVMPLAEGEAVAEDGGRWRLSRDHAHGWLLARDAGDGGWAPQYSFGTDHIYASDLALSNHWTATAPGTRFTTERIVSLVLPSGFASLTGTRYSRRNGDQAVDALIESPAAYRLRLQWVFGLALSNDEVRALGLFG